MVSALENRISVAQFLERDDFEEGYIYELINGEIMKRTSPNVDHQETSMMLSTFMNLHIMQNKLGRLFAAPTDVYLNEFSLVVPDLVFVSNNKSEIIHERRCVKGVPDLIVEILSKGTQGVDRGKKMRWYKKFGVHEYWIVNPREQTVEVYELQNGDYEMVSYAAETGIVDSTVLTDFSLDVSTIFS